MIRNSSSGGKASYYYYPILGFLVRVRHRVDLSMESWGGGLDEALILLYRVVDDGYRMVT